VTQIDVITPSVDRPDALRRAVASVRMQTHSDWRMWVIDDGDGRAARLANALQDDRVVGVMNDGSGQVDARMTGIRHGQGGVIMLLDDDDVLTDAAHLAQVADVLGHAEALCHRAGWMVFEQNGMEVRREVFDPPTTAASLRQDNTVLTCGLAWRRATTDRLGPLDASLGGYYDWDWILRVLDAGVPLHKVPGLGVGYTIHENNASAKRDAARTRMFEAFKAKHGLEIVQKDHLTVHQEGA
jgi:glycosyltransferase involved in cell wall biosynthesis